MGLKKAAKTAAGIVKTIRETEKNRPGLGGTPASKSKTSTKSTK